MIIKTNCPSIISFLYWSSSYTHSAAVSSIRLLRALRFLCLFTKWCFLPIVYFITFFGLLSKQQFIIFRAISHNFNKPSKKAEMLFVLSSMKSINLIYLHRLFMIICRSKHHKTSMFLWLKMLIVNRLTLFGWYKWIWRTRSGKVKRKLFKRRQWVCLLIKSYSDAKLAFCLKRVNFSSSCLCSKLLLFFLLIKVV